MHFPFANVLRLFFMLFFFFFFLCFLLFTYFWHLQCHGKPQPQNQSDICLQWNDPFCWHKVVALYCSCTAMKTGSSGPTRCVFMHIKEKKVGKAIPASLVQLKENIIKLINRAENWAQTPAYESVVSLHLCDCLHAAVHMWVMSVTSGCSSILLIEELASGRLGEVKPQLTRAWLHSLLVRKNTRFTEAGYDLRGYEVTNLSLLGKNLSIKMHNCINRGTALEKIDELSGSKQMFALAPLSRWRDNTVQLQRLDFDVLGFSHTYTHWWGNRITTMFLFMWR